MGARLDFRKQLAQEGLASPTSRDGGGHVLRWNLGPELLLLGFIGTGPCDIEGWRSGVGIVGTCASALKTGERIRSRVPCFPAGWSHTSALHQGPEEAVETATDAKCQCFTVTYVHGTGNGHRLICAGSFDFCANTKGKL